MSINRKRRRSRLALLALAALAGCSPEAPGAPGKPTGPRLVVLYSTCTVSKDFLSPYHADVEYTPNFRAFADDSVVFERHNTEAGQSGIAFASIFSGVQADRHHIYHHPQVLSDDLYLIGEAFRDNGYETYFWSGQELASAALNYGQGIDAKNVYLTDKKFTKHAQQLGEQFLTETTANGPELDAVLDHLKADPTAHAFLQVNFTISHELYHEYVTPAKIEAFRERYPARATSLTHEEILAGLKFFEDHRHSLQLDHDDTVAKLGMTPADVQRLDQVLQLTYATCIAQLDDYFGQFLGKIDAAGLRDDSLIAFTADHGETFWHASEPLHWMHGLQLAPTVIEVPWIVRGKSAGVVPSRYPGVTRSIDVFPTLAGLAHLALPASVHLDGVDLANVARGEAPTDEEQQLVAFSHTTTLGEKRLDRYRREGHRTVVEMLPEPEPKYLWVRLRDGDMDYELRPDAAGDVHAFAFDLARDRFRATNVLDESDPAQARRMAELRAYRERLITAFDPDETVDDDEAFSLLKDLGYVGKDKD